MTAPLTSQTLVKDINTGMTDGLGLAIQEMIHAPSGMLFSAGKELWWSNGSSHTLVQRDAFTFPAYSAPEEFVWASLFCYFRAGKALWAASTGAGGALVVKLHEFESFGPKGLVTLSSGGLFFVGHDGQHGWELWKASATGTTTRVTDLWPGRNHGVSTQAAPVEYRGRLYFAGRDGTATGVELWSSDGTAAGTRLVVDLGPGHSLPRHLTVSGSSLYFAATPTAHGPSLYKTDGTASGTQRLATVAAEHLVDAQGTLFFAGQTSAHGKELWKSDGTTSGTRLVKDIESGSGSSSPKTFFAVGSQIFFSAQTSAAGRELWTSNGTSVGTVLLEVATGTRSANPEPIGTAGANLVFGANQTSRGVWATDGTTTGTILLTAAAPNGPGTLWRGELYFGARRRTGVNELYKTNGKPAGTVTVTNLAPRTGMGSSISSLTASIPGRVAFAAAETGIGNRLWHSRGTNASTSWLTDYSSNPPANSLVDADGTLYFVARDVPSGRELRRSDGTRATTRLVKDIRLGSTSAFLGGEHRLVEIDGTIYFPANDGKRGIELWKSDGTTSGTVIVRDIRLSSPSSAPTELVRVGDTVFFTADDGRTGRELWTLDHTTGARLVRDIRSGSSSPTDLTNVNGTLYFVVDDRVHGKELWKSDGTTAGTVLVKDIRTGGTGSNPRHLTALGSTLFFVAHDGPKGVELWKSDGTAGGTAIVSDIAPGKESSNPDHLTAAYDTLFFAAYRPAEGVELWKSDGTTATLVKDIGMRVTDSFPHHITQLGSGRNVVFTAIDYGWGFEVWTSDGTTSGTGRMTDIAPGQRSSNPGPYVRSGTQVYFVADDGTHGPELWVMNLASTGASLAVPVGRRGIGTGGRPSIGRDGLPSLGNRKFAITLTDAMPNTAAVFMLSPPISPVHLFKNCTLYAALPMILFPLPTSQTGTAKMPLPIGTDQTLLGVEVMGQFLIFDKQGCFAPLLALSNGLQVLVGK